MKQMLMGLGGMAGMFALFSAITAATGQRFQFANPGSARGVPLGGTWIHVVTLALVAAALWLIGKRWDAPGFVDVRTKHPWLVPVVGVFVVFPVTLVVIFLFVR